MNPFFRRPSLPPPLPYPVPLSNSNPFSTNLPIPTNHESITSYWVIGFGLEINAVHIKDGVAFLGYVRQEYMAWGFYGPEYSWTIEFVQNEFGYEVLAPINWRDYIR